MLNLIVAPKSIAANGVKYTRKIVKFLKTEKVEYSVYFSMSLEDISENVKELISIGEMEFVVIGNDAVLSQTINTFKDLSRVKIGIVPTSKNDDFAKYLELETNPIKAIKRILEKKTTEIDMMLVNEIKVVNNVVIGASVDICEKFQQAKWKSFIVENVLSNKINSEYKGMELNLYAKNAKAKTETIYELIVANGGYSKGRKVSPLSNVQDGIFNLIYSDFDTQKTNKKILSEIKKGNHIYNDQVKQQWLTNLKITNADNKIKAMIDGKIYNLDKLDITLVEKCLKIYK